MERYLLMLELVLGAGAAALFAVLYTRGRPRPKTPEGRQLLIMSIAQATEMSLLLAVLVGWRPPGLVLALLIGYAVMDFVLIRWVMLLTRAQKGLDHAA